MNTDQKAAEFYKRWKNVMNLGDGLAQQFVTELAHALELFSKDNRPARDE